MFCFVDLRRTIFSPAPEHGDERIDGKDDFAAKNALLTSKKTEPVPGHNCCVRATVAKRFEIHCRRRCQRDVEQYSSDTLDEQTGVDRGDEKLQLVVQPMVRHIIFTERHAAKSWRRVSRERRDGRSRCSTDLYGLLWVV